MWGYFNGFVTGLRWAVPGRQRLAVSELAPSVFPNLRYLSVTRRDKVRQAVSLWRALQSWSWSSDQVPRRRGRSPALQRGRHRPPDPRHPGPRGRVAGLLPRVRRRAAHGRVRGLRAGLRGHHPRHPAPPGIPEAETAAIAAPQRRPQSDGLSQSGPSATGPSRAGSPRAVRSAGCGSTRPSPTRCSCSPTAPGRACARRSWPGSPRRSARSASPRCGSTSPTCRRDGGPPTVRRCSWRHGVRRSPRPSAGPAGGRCSPAASRWAGGSRRWPPPRACPRPGSCSSAIRCTRRGGPTRSAMRTWTRCRADALPAGDARHLRPARPARGR